MVLGGRDLGVRSLMGLVTAHRNISPAIVVAAQNFPAGNTLKFILVAAILTILILLPATKRLGASIKAPGKAVVKSCELPH